MPYMGNDFEDTSWTAILLIDKNELKSFYKKNFFKQFCYFISAKCLRQLNFKENIFNMHNIIAILLLSLLLLLLLLLSLLLLILLLCPTCLPYLSYLLGNWKELLPAVNCKLWKACDKSVIKCLKEPHIIDISIAREIIWIKKK